LDSSGLAPFCNPEVLGVWRRRYGLLGGTKGVFVEIAKGDFNQLFKVLAD
jgi:roadblock/LC7 domain-containing protein